MSVAVNDEQRCLYLQAVCYRDFFQKLKKKVNLFCSFFSLGQRPFTLYSRKSKSFSAKPTEKQEKIKLEQIYYNVKKNVSHFVPKKLK